MVRIERGLKMTEDHKIGRRAHSFLSSPILLFIKITSINLTCSSSSPRMLRTGEDENVLAALVVPEAATKRPRTSSEDTRPSQLLSRRENRRSINWKVKRIYLKLSG